MDAETPSASEIIRFCANLNRALTAQQAEALYRYLQLLLKWNRRTNLVGTNDWQIIISDLVADSWHLADFVQTLSLPTHPRCVDLGAGAGLPGIPLRLFWTIGEYHLVEIRQKRTAFLLQAVAAVGLSQTLVRPQPAEQALSALAPIDLCLSRAFMPWLRLVDLVRPWLATNGLLVIMANESVPATLPDPWRLAGSHVYTAAGKTRYFWALAAASISK